MLEGVAVAQRERCKTLREMAANSRYFFQDIGAYDAKAAAQAPQRGDARRCCSS